MVSKTAFEIPTAHSVEDELIDQIVQRVGATMDHGQLRYWKRLDGALHGPSWDILALDHNYLAHSAPSPTLASGPRLGFQTWADAKLHVDFHLTLAQAVKASVSNVLKHCVFVAKYDTDPELTPIISAVFEKVPDVVRARRQALTQQQIEALVDVYMVNDPLGPAMAELARDNAEAQARFLKRWPVLTAEDVAGLAGHGSKNKSATATRWKGAGKIFGMRAGGREVYPQFQFQEGAPHPTIGKVLAALPDTFSGWQTAFWFVGSNGWLGDKAPVARLDDTAALIAAARHEGEAWAG